LILLTKANAQRRLDTKPYTRPLAVAVELPSGCISPFTSLCDHGAGVPAPRRREHPHSFGPRRRRRSDVRRPLAAPAAPPRLLLRARPASPAMPLVDRAPSSLPLLCATCVYNRYRFVCDVIHPQCHPFLVDLESKRQARHA